MNLIGSQTSIRAEAMSFSDLFEMGTFSVPWHQRHYDWDTPHVTALLNDIEEARREKRVCYFLGSIMLIDSGGDHWEINDGQQRMITVSLIVARLCRMAVDENPDAQRVKIALGKLFVVERDAVCSLDDADGYRARIAPPRNDLTRYHQIIRGNPIGTNGKLTSAWKEIDAFLTNRSLSDAYRYFDYLVKKTEVAVLRVPKVVDPNAVYETLNFRGKKLDDVDLIRNHLYSFFSDDADEHQREVVRENIERIGDALTRRGKSRNRSAEEYLRCHTQCLFGHMRSQHFYHDFRTKMREHLDSRRSSGRTDTAQVFQLIEELSDRAALRLFQMITAPGPDPEAVAEFERRAKTTGRRRRLAVFLRELRNYTVVQPLLFSMFMVYAKESDARRLKRIAKEINRSLGRLATFVLRTAFVVPKFVPSLYEADFADLARDMASAGKITEMELADLLRKRDAQGVLDDQQFRELMMRVKKMTGSLRIRSFLLGVNATFAGDFSLLNEERCTLEHILPTGDEHWNGWTGFEKVDESEYVHRLGNLTLMGPDDNRPGKRFNGSFKAKRGSYEQSSVAMTRRVAKWDDWNPDVVTERGDDLIERAIRVWTFEG